MHLYSLARSLHRDKIWSEKGHKQLQIKCRNVFLSAGCLVFAVSRETKRKKNDFSSNRSRLLGRYSKKPNTQLHEKHFLW